MMFVGLVALNDSLKDESYAWLANLGVFVGVAALATTAVLQAVDGIALKFMVDDWASASEERKESVFQAALAVRQIETGVARFATDTPWDVGAYCGARPGSSMAQGIVTVDPYQLA